jgi:F-type H+-transporting ATPase subunit gamma
MATLKQIRRRIRSVQSTQQITKAMEMVAAAKLKRAQDRVVTARPYAAGIRELLANLTAASETLSHPLFEKRPVERRAFVVIASDKGLCGSYNMNIFRTMERMFESGARDKIVLHAIGRRANQYFSKRNWKMARGLPESGDLADPAKAKELGAELVRAFLAREVDRVDLLYTQFVSTMTRRVICEPLLPVAPEGGGAGRRKLEYIFEPTPEKIFSTLLPRYVENRIFQAMSESLASEHSARMVSMGAATKNAADVIGSLTLVRNRLRQAAITRELSEIVGGADALK